jgi:hypothetical protein
MSRPGATVAWLTAGVLAAAALGTACVTAPPAEARPVVAPAEVQGGAWFEQTGCTACHSVSVYGIHSLAATAPDLSVAVADVRTRFGRTLEDFLHAPSGTMEMVLKSRIPMTSADRDLAIRKLQEAYRAYQRQAARPTVSH